MKFIDFFNQQDVVIKKAIVYSIGIIVAITAYALITSIASISRKTDTTRCVEAYLEAHKYDTKLKAYEACRRLLKR